MPSRRVTLNNSEWTLVANGTFWFKNVGGRPAYIMDAAAQPAAGVSVREAVVYMPSDEPTDIGVVGPWWGRCDNENSTTHRECDLVITEYV